MVTVRGLLKTPATQAPFL